MIRQTTLVRDRILSLTTEMMRRLHAYVSALPEFEHDLLLQLEAPRQFDTAALVAEGILQRLNGETEALPKFNKIRRALRKKIPKGPRGVPRKLQAPKPIPAEVV